MDLRTFWKSSFLSNFNEIAYDFKVGKILISLFQVREENWNPGRSSAFKTPEYSCYIECSSVYIKALYLNCH